MLRSGVGQRRVGSCTNSSCPFWKFSDLTFEAITRSFPLIVLTLSLFYFIGESRFKSFWSGSSSNPNLDFLLLEVKRIDADATLIIPFPSIAVPLYVKSAFTELRFGRIPSPFRDRGEAGWKFYRAMKSGLV